MSRAPSNAVTPVAGACARDGTVGPARTARAIVAKAATFTQRIEASTLNPDDYTVSRLERGGKGDTRSSVPMFCGPAMNSAGTPLFHWRSVL
jgi:hypothetical protein